MTSISQLSVQSFSDVSTDKVTMETMHSRCYFSITSLSSPVFGGPMMQHSYIPVQYSHAMNTQCVQHSFRNCMFVPE